MNIPPDALVELKDIPSYDVVAIEIDNPVLDQVQGYYVRSTATINVEDKTLPTSGVAKENLDAIANHLLAHPNPQLVISIHGYATQESSSRERSRSLYEYITFLAQQGVEGLGGTVFLGYRWPSENPMQDDPVDGQPPVRLLDKLRFSLQALPTLLLGSLIGTIVLGLVYLLLGLGHFPATAFLPVAIVAVAIAILLSLVLRWRANAMNLLPVLTPALISMVVLACAIAVFAPVDLSWLFIVLAIIHTAILGMVLALLGLRLSAYPRDRYRARDFGVMDLVEVLRQIDQRIMQSACQRHGIEQAALSQTAIESEPLCRSRVKLSFIAHSLGCEVATQTIRILSDVFDSSSIDKIPTSAIGRVFCLERLALIAPDIPVEAVLSGRANFLRSSLRRCEEAYVFSNEADLALRIASTAVNYTMFPSRRRFRGYKLGNITVKRNTNSSDRSVRILDRAEYGIVNWQNERFLDPLECLEIRASNLEHRSLDQLADLGERNLQDDSKAVANLFTYFDCTDYLDVEIDPAIALPENPIVHGVLSFAKRKSALSFFKDYLQLCIAYFAERPRYVNTHGGYFSGRFSQTLIYGLAFLGYRRFLASQVWSNTLTPFAQVAPLGSATATDDMADLVKQFSVCCQQRQIQVVLPSKLIAK